MPFYKFGTNDIFHNAIKTHPQCKFFIYSGSIYYNNKPQVSGAFTSSVTHVPTGHISLYEMNVDRPSDQLVYPYVSKESSLMAPRTISLKSYNNSSLFAYGDTLSSSYPLSATISKDFYAEDGSRNRITALKNTLDYYTPLSRHYSYSSSFGDKSTQATGLISIPSIFYGSTIKKRSVSLRYYLTGTLIGELKDKGGRGELIQVGPTGSTGSGSVAGVVLYNEGFILLTGSWPISNHVEPYVSGDSKPRWIDFGSTGSAGSGGENLPATSFDMSFSGTTNIPVLTMFAHAREGQLNHSNNPTSISRDNRLYLLNQTSASTQYSEPTSVTIKNIGSSSFQNTIPTYEKTVFISQIGIYDEDKNLIAVAKLANPVRKRNQDDFTFKLKLDF